MSSVKLFIMYSFNNSLSSPDDFTDTLPTGNLVGTYYVFYMATVDADAIPWSICLRPSLAFTIWGIFSVTLHERHS